MEKIHILLVEDNEGDILLTIEALRDGRLNNTISVVRNGEEALQYLNKEDPYVNEINPDLVLLDINLPKMDGMEVLSYIKSHPQFKRIPVIMLTTSSSEKDIMESYNKYANCYIVKPVNLGTFMEVVRSIEDFWISIVQYPKTD